MIIGSLIAVIFGKRNRNLLTTELLLICSAVVVPCWYIVFLNHTIEHSWFMFRIMVWPIAVAILMPTVIVFENVMKVRRRG